MNTQTPLSDDDLVLLYYGEHDDPGLAARVAESPELSRRFEALGAGLALTEGYQAPLRSPDYGARVWQSIAPQLGERTTTVHGPLRRWWLSLAAPRFSVAGAFAIAAVAVLAFWLGREQAAPVAPTTSPPTTTAALAPFDGLDPQRLLTASVAGHLDQVDLALTEFANAVDPAANEADWAMDMLVANRLYRRTAEARGDRRLAAFLGELEPTLIELAYTAQTASPPTRARLQQDVRDNLLFRVRVMNQQLKQTGIRT